MDKDRAEKEYAAVMGADALERQKRLAKEQCSECGVKRGHTVTCKRGRRLAAQKLARDEKKKR